MPRFIKGPDVLNYLSQMANFADPFLFTVLLAIVSIGITLVGAVIIDYFGRRTLFMWSACITWITLILIGTLGVAVKSMPGSVERFVVSAAPGWTVVPVDPRSLCTGLLVHGVAHGIYYSRRSGVVICCRSRFQSTSH